MRCQLCRNSFYVKPSHQKLGWGKYCSVQCRNKARLEGKRVKCAVCRKELYRSLAQIKHSKSGSFFCSKSCQTKWRNHYFIEEKHPNWQSGINAYRKILLRTGKVPACIACGVDDIRVLAVHHLDHNRKNNTKSNLSWVCLNCHYLIHHDEDFELNFKKKIQSN